LRLHPKCARCGLAARRNGGLSQDALTSYLLFGSVSEPVTMFEGVFFPAAGPPHAGIRAGTGEKFLGRILGGIRDGARLGATRKNLATLARAVQAVKPMLADAVRAHLIADVPVGLFLSSGLDREQSQLWPRASTPGIQSFNARFSKHGIRRIGIDTEGRHALRNKS